MRTGILKCLDRGQQIDMIYISKTGDISKRRVKILSVDETSFKAYCFLRNTKRTFKIDNVLAFAPIANRERDVS